MNSVDLIKEKIDFVELVSKYTNLKKSGRSFVGLCPFHNEKTPSFSVDPDQKLFHCFGCGKGGDIITFIMEIEKLSFGEAIEYLAKEYNIDLPKKKYKGSKIENDIYNFNQSILEFYQKALYSDSGKDAYRYLKEVRGFSDETIKEFKLGFAPENINLYPENIKNYPLNILIRSGNFVKQNNRLIPFMKNRIIIPIMSISDRALAFGGRSIGNEMPKYKNSPDTPVYKKRNSLFGLNLTKKFIREEEFAILVEGYFDLISLYHHGVKNVVASLGTSLTVEQAYLLKKFTDKVIIFYDFDSAGINAIKRAFPILFEAGIYIEIFRGEKGLDPDDFIKKYGKDGLINKLKKPFTPIHFYIGEKKISDPVKKKKAIESIANILIKIDDAIFLDEYINEASDMLNVSSQYLRDIINKKRFKNKRIDENTKKIEADIDLFEKIIINFLYNTPFELVKPYLTELREEYFDFFQYPSLVRSIIKSKDINSESFEESLNKFLNENELKILYSIVFNKEDFYSEQDFSAALNLLKAKYIETKIEHLNKILKEKEKNGDSDELKKILKEKIKLVAILDKLNIEEVINGR